MSADRRAARWRSGLVAAEVAMSALLLVGGGLLVRTLIEMRSAPLGFDADGLYAVSLVLPGDRYADVAARQGVIDELTRRLSAAPGVRGVVPALSNPAEPGITFGALEVEGGPPAASGGRDVIGYNPVAPGFFRLAGIPVLEGREFGPVAGEDGVIVSANLARRLRPTGSALGVRFRLSASAPWRPVIGVVGDVTIPRAGGGLGIREVVYPLHSPSTPQTRLVVRATDQATGLLAAVRSVAGAVDPGIEVAGVQSVSQVAEEARALPRFVAGILTLFAIVAVLMSAIGLYGVIAYTVTLRWREIGIRLALGAQPADVLRSVLVTGVAMVAIGLAAGMASAYVLTGSLRSVLFGVAPLDALTFTGAGLLVAVVAVVAVVVPAYRALRVDPVSVLREA